MEVSTLNRKGQPVTQLLPSGVVQVRAGTHPKFRYVQVLDGSAPAQHQNDFVLSQTTATAASRLPVEELGRFERGDLKGQLLSKATRAPKRPCKLKALAWVPDDRSSSAWQQDSCASLTLPLTEVTRSNMCMRTYEMLEVFAQTKA